MTTSTTTLTAQERADLELMLEAPSAIELHGTDKAWQQALTQVVNPAPARPSLRGALGFDGTAEQDAPAARPRG